MCLEICNRVPDACSAEQRRLLASPDRAREAVTVAASVGADDHNHPSRMRPRLPRQRAPLWSQSRCRREYSGDDCRWASLK